MPSNYTKEMIKIHMSRNLEGEELRTHGQENIIHIQRFLRVLRTVLPDLIGNSQQINVAQCWLHF